MLVQDNIGSYDFIFRTNDGGQNWTKLVLASNSAHHDIEFLPGCPSSIWFTDYNNLFFSSDTGNTWQEFIIDINNLEGRNIEFFDDQIGLLLCDNDKIFFTSNNGGITTSINDTSPMRSDFNLYQNYPNPFNPATTIKYELPKEGMVTLKIYDILGREVKILVNEKQSVGRYELTFDASNFAAGVYIYRLQAGEFIQSKKMILLK
jgi:hypothetical protein